MPDAQGMFVWYELMTTDPDGAKAFYDSVVGWNVASEAEFPNGYRMIGRYDGKQAGGVMPIDDEMASKGGRPIWLGYIAVHDVDAAVAAIEADGGKVMVPAWDIPGVGRIGMVTDPAGAPFYIMKPTPPMGDVNAQSDVFHTEHAQHVRWNELSTTDPQGALAFYTRHFGWRQEGEMDMGELGQYQFLYHDETMIGAVMPKMPEMPVSMWSFYIGVDDIDRAHEAVKAGGGQVLMGPMEIPGGEFSINGMDPQGAPFGLVGPRKS
jgi:predicted enzyme related to lactoylglutathione lyase